MKKAILGLGLVLSTALPLNVSARTVQEHCSEFAGYARVIMMARQADLPLTQVMERLKDSNKGIQKLALVAYDWPVVVMGKQQVIDDFTNWTAGLCYKNNQ